MGLAGVGAAAQADDERLVLMHNADQDHMPANTGPYSLARQDNPVLAENAVETDDEQALRSYLAANVCVNPTEPNRFSGSTTSRWSA